MAIADGELIALEIAQLGYIIFRQSTGAITTITISKSTLKQTLSTGGTNTAGLITTNVTNFDGFLSAADTNVQAALETLDEWGKMTDGFLLIGRTGTSPVKATLTAGAGITITPASGAITVAYNGGSGSVSTLTGDAGGAISPSTGNINILGGNLLTATGSGSTITLDVDNFVTTTSWTPEISFAGGQTGITYGTQTGYYSRIGNILFFSAIIALTSKGSSTGVLRLQNLPVNPITSTVVLTTLLGNVTFSGETVVGQTGSTYIIFQFSGNASQGTTGFTDTHCDNDLTIRCSGFYFV